MIHNPYPSQINNVDKDALRFQTYLSGEDKALLVSVRPIKGTAQVVINHLIKHLCDDLRDLNITSYRPDADDIFSILVQRRPLSDEQVAALRRTSVGATQQIPTWLQQHRRRTKLREGVADPASSADHVQVKAPTGKQRVRTKKSETKADKETTTNS